MPEPTELTIPDEAIRAFRDGFERAVEAMSAGEDGPEIDGVPVDGDRVATEAGLRAALPFFAEIWQREFDATAEGLARAAESTQTPRTVVTLANGTKVAVGTVSDPYAGPVPDDRALAEAAEAIARELGTEFDAAAHQDVVQQVVDLQLCADEAADEVRYRQTAARVRCEVVEEVARAIEAYQPEAHPVVCPPEVAYEAAMETAARIARQHAEPGGHRG